MTQQYSLASLAAWRSSMSISHHNLLPHVPSICLSAVNSSSHSGIAPQSPNSSSQLLSLPGDLHLCPAYVWLQQVLHFFRLLQISCFTPSLTRFSSDADSCPHVGIRPLLQFPHPLRVGPALQTLLFFPLVPTKLCAGLYIHFRWSGTPVRSQLVFCMHFCV